MTNREFVVWLIGFLELCEPVAIDRKMLFILKNHLNLVIAVEKELGEINQQIYNEVTRLLDQKQDGVELFNWLKNLLSHLLK
jgi:hypothetical protein